MNKKWKTISSRIAYKNPWFHVRQDRVMRPDGKKGIYGVVERPNANFIVALLDDNKILLVEEYRYPVKQSVMQLPAGTTNQGETDLGAAKRELYEETGFRARTWRKISSFFIAPGHESIVANVFLAKDCRKKKSHNNGEPNELIAKVHSVSIPYVKRMIGENKIKCGITLASLNLFFQIIKK